MDEDHRLIEAVLGGDRHAYRSLVERYQDFVFTIAHRVLQSREEAEEAAQDAFFKAFKMLRTFGRKSKFSTWLYTIAYRSAIDKARRKNLRIKSLDEEESVLQVEDTNYPNPLEATNQHDLQEIIQRALKKLKPADATLVTLFYLKENSVKEVAEITGMSVSNVKTRLHRLREQLKTLLSKQLKSEIQDLL